MRVNDDHVLTGYLEPTSGSIGVDQLQIDTDMRAIQARMTVTGKLSGLAGDDGNGYLKYQAHLHGVEDAKIQPAVVDAVRHTSLKKKATSSVKRCLVVTANGSVSRKPFFIVRILLFWTSLLMDLTRRKFYKCAISSVN